MKGRFFRAGHDRKTGGFRQVRSRRGKAATAPADEVAAAEPVTEREPVAAAPKARASRKKAAPKVEAVAEAPIAVAEEVKAVEVAPAAVVEEAPVVTEDAEPAKPARANRGDAVSSSDPAIQTNGGA